MTKTKQFDKTKLAVGIGAALLVFTTQSVLAQSIEEVIVTATKRDQSLQDVGIAVTALTADNIREYGISNAIDVIAKAPSLDNYSTFGPGSNANITIRGFGLNDFGDGHEAPVTAYLDEFYLVSVPAVDFAIYDLERIEILRGPQGTLFGRNSTGGLLHYVTAKPTEELTGNLAVSVAEFGEVKVEAAISGPLSDKVAGRLSVLSHESDGYIENLNPALEDGGQAGTQAIRGQLLFTPRDDLEILVKAEFADIDKVHSYYEQQPLNPADPVTGLFSTATDPNATDGAGYNEALFANGAAAARNVTNTSNPQRLEQDGLNLLLRVEKDFDNFLFTSISGYQDLDRDIVEDCDASPNAICAAIFPYQTDWFSQEFRLNGQTDAMRWTAGLYYLDQTAEAQPDASFSIPVGGPGAVDAATGLYNGPFLPISLSADWNQDTTSYSVFGQLEYDLSDRVTAIAGVRVGRDEKDFIDVDNATLRSCPGFFIPSNCFPAGVPDPNGTPGTGIANPFSDDYSESLVSWKLGLDYRATDDVLLYASISQGTKSGGFNNGFYAGPTGADPENLIPYDSEENIAYEAGIKSTMLDNRLRINGSIFYYDYSDFQTFNFEGLGGLVGNNDATASGAELELEAYLTDNLNVTLGASFLNAEIEDLSGRNVNFIADRDNANAPDVTANGSIAYDFALSGQATAKVIWDWSYMAERFTNNFEEPTAELESFFKHNITAAVDWNDNWRLSAYVRNLSDEENTIKVFTFSDLGYRQIVNAQGRTFGGSVSYSF